MQKNQLPKETIKFLANKESDAEKAGIIHWYDDLSTNAPIAQSAVAKTKKRAKKKLMNSINEKPKRVLNNYWLRIGAAAVLLIVGYFGWLQYQKEEIPQLASATQLAAIKPAQERAIITLENGQEIDLDQLAINEQVHVGDIIIIKDSKGQVSYINSKTGEPQMNSIRVPKASIYTLALSDGSKVTLNSESKLSYPSQFEGQVRKVKLEGEAYFEIQKTADHKQFIVETDLQEIEVLGTKFNIKAFDFDDENFSTLAEGSVKVRNKESLKEGILKPGQQAFQQKGAEFSVKTVDVEKVLGWTNGQFIFDGDNNHDTFKEIGRWYDIEIEYQQSLKIDQYLGKIPRNLPLDKLIDLLKYAELTVEARVVKNNRIKLHIS